MNPLEPLGRVVGGAGDRVARAAAARVPGADLDERDPEYIADRLTEAWLIASLYFRAEVRGIERVPETGPVLLVGNHTGGNLSPETMTITLAFVSYFGAERPFYQLAHNLVLSFPGLGFLRKFGTVAASRENARKALRAGAAVLVFPGGDWEVHRPSWEGDKIDFGGRKGFLRLALEENVPIVPVVTIGGQETALFLTRGDKLARLLRLDRLFRLKVLPINISLPWVLDIGDMVPRIPLPAKITSEVLDPIDLREMFGPEPDLDKAYDHVTGLMQAKLSELAAERRFPILG